MNHAQRLHAEAFAACARRLRHAARFNCGCGGGGRSEPCPLRAEPDPVLAEHARQNRWRLQAFLARRRGHALSLWDNSRPRNPSSEAEKRLRQVKPLVYRIIGHEGLKAILSEGRPIR